MPGKPWLRHSLKRSHRLRIGQLHDDDELAVDDVEAFEREDIGMANGLDTAEGFEFLLGALAAVVGAGKVAEDELDGLVQAARRFRFPNFAEAAAAESFDEPVARNRFGMAFDPHRHKVVSKGVRPKCAENGRQQIQVGAASKERHEIAGIHHPVRLLLNHSFLPDAPQIPGRKFLMGAEKWSTWVVNAARERSN